MAKYIKDELVNEYMQAKMKAAKQEVVVETLAKKLRDLEKKGFEHPLLRFDDNNSFRPDWKKLVMELIEKYMKPGQRAIFLNGLKKRFKTTKGAKRINILAPKYEDFCKELKAEKELAGVK